MGRVLEYKEWDHGDMTYLFDCCGKELFTNINESTLRYCPFCGEEVTGIGSVRKIRRERSSRNYSYSLLHTKDKGVVEQCLKNVEIVAVDGYGNEKVAESDIPHYCKRDTFFSTDDVLKGLRELREREEDMFYLDERERRTFTFKVIK